MIPLHRDRHFTFRFGDDRIIPRFHLDGVAAGVRVSVLGYDATTETRLGLDDPAHRMSSFSKSVMVAEPL